MGEGSHTFSDSTVFHGEDIGPGASSGPDGAETTTQYKKNEIVSYQRALFTFEKAERGRHIYDQAILYLSENIWKENGH